MIQKDSFAQFTHIDAIADYGVTSEVNLTLPECLNFLHIAIEHIRMFFDCRIKYLENFLEYPRREESRFDKFAALKMG